MNMNPEQLASLVRGVMLLGAGWALAHGIDASTWLALTAGVVALATVLQSLYARTYVNQALSVANNPDVVHVVGSPALVLAAGSDKVITAPTIQSMIETVADHPGVEKIVANQSIVNSAYSPKVVTQ